MNAASILKDVFGFGGYRPGQQDIVGAVTAGQNTLAIMPTGGGKSLCYQLPALLREGVTIVVSPLIALMRDQVRFLRENGVEAHALTSANTDAETEAALASLRCGECKLLYLAPERLASNSAQRMLRNIGVGLIAVDEAHCVSQWGHDFRPDYLRIGDLKQALGVPLAAFTATADEATRHEIIEKLFDGATPQVFLHGFDRPNIHLAFAVKDKPRAQIMAFAAARRGQSGIVYCGTRAKTETLAKALAEDGHITCSYHGGMDSDERRNVEQRFQRDDGLIVCATVAFGMGIDKPDIRWVAHADLPKSIESYYQEIGRAGRDGAAAETLTLFGPDDIRFRRQQIDESLAPSDRRLADHGRLNSLLGLAEALECRRRVLLQYFGEDAEGCGNCDLCDKPAEVFDGTTTVRMALSAALRTDQQFGATHLIDILRGSMTDKIAARAHDALPTFGVGKEYSRSQWQAIFRQMMGHDLLRPDPERHGALRMTSRARPILRGEETIILRKDTIRSAKSGPKVRQMVAEEDAALFSALKSKRRAFAEQQGVPAYVIFNDRTLIEMTQRRPQTLDEMARVGGVGAKKLSKYGQAFLAVITSDIKLTHPARQKLAGQKAGSVYDRLLEVQAGLRRGEDGTQKPLSCSASLLAKVANTCPYDAAAIERIIGPKYAERFGNAFLEVLRE